MNKSILAFALTFTLIGCASKKDLSSSSGHFLELEYNNKSLEEVYECVDYEFVRFPLYFEREIDLDNRSASIIIGVDGVAFFYTVLMNDQKLIMNPSRFQIIVPNIFEGELVASVKKCTGNE